MTAAWNVIKAWLVTVTVAGLLGLLGYVIGEFRLASIFAFAGLLLCLSMYWAADRAIMGMLGARELPEGENPTCTQLSRDSRRALRWSSLGCM